MPLKTIVNIFPKDEKLQYNCEGKGKLGEGLYNVIYKTLKHAKGNPTSRTCDWLCDFEQVLCSQILVTFF